MNTLRKTWNKMIIAIKQVSKELLTPVLTVAAGTI